MKASVAAVAARRRTPPTLIRRSIPRARVPGCAICRVWAAPVSARPPQAAPAQRLALHAASPAPMLPASSPDWGRAPAEPADAPGQAISWNRPSQVLERARALGEREVDDHDHDRDGREGCREGEVVRDADVRVDDVPDEVRVPDDLRGDVVAEGQREREDRPGDDRRERE